MLGVKDKRKKEKKEYAFALGVEWAMFRAQMSTGRPFVTLCLPENRTRLVKLVERYDRLG